MGYSLATSTTSSLAGPGGAVRFVRRELGVEAFGINWFELPPNAGGREHDETRHRPGGGQRRHRAAPARIASRASDVPVRAGTFIRFDPGTTRFAIAGPEGMTMIAVGARPGSYEPRGPF